MLIYLAINKDFIFFIYVAKHYELHVGMQKYVYLLDNLYQLHIFYI